MIQWEQIRERHKSVFLVISPPRCASTAFARVFWRHPAIRYYSHEPFEQTYFENRPLHQAVQNLNEPIDLREFTDRASKQNARGLIIKEMPYQVGTHFPTLIDLSDRPVIFLVRDPRLNIASRMDRKRQANASPYFPPIETGWRLLSEQIQFCREQKRDYLIIDAADFRNQPKLVFGQVFARLGLQFRPEFLRWQPQTQVPLDNLQGAHAHLYRRVLASRGIQPAKEPVPALESFSNENGWRAHVQRSLIRYHNLLQDPHRIGL
jgi:hypothetical protein